MNLDSFHPHTFVGQWFSIFKRMNRRERVGYMDLCFEKLLIGYTMTTYIGVEIFTMCPAHFFIVLLKKHSFFYFHWPIMAKDEIANIIRKTHKLHKYMAKRNIICITYPPY